MIIVGGTATNGIDENLSKLMGARLVKVEHKVFPDGESYIRFHRLCPGRRQYWFRPPSHPRTRTSWSFS